MSVFFFGGGEKGDRVHEGDLGVVMVEKWANWSDIQLTVYLFCAPLVIFF